MKYCSSCSDSEIYNEPAAVKVSVRDPETGRTFRKLLCSDHLQMFDDDGYELTVIESLTNRRNK